MHRFFLTLVPPTQRIPLLNYFVLIVEDEQRNCVKQQMNRETYNGVKPSLSAKESRLDGQCSRSNLAMSKFPCVIARCSGVVPPQSCTAADALASSSISAIYEGK